MQIIKEEKANIYGELGKVSKKLDVFYNPVMKFNRDITILLLNCIPNTQIQACDLLAGSGIRSLRFLKELKKEKLKSIFINDKHSDFFNIMQQNLKLNRINEKKVKYYLKDENYVYLLAKSANCINKKLIVNKKINITNEDGSHLLLKTSGFDYIDIDPFGSPNPFLDASIKMISREGILGITLTDTSALTGTYLSPSRRKYWANALKNDFMHETGVRIFIRKAQLIGAQYEKALKPVLSIAKDHYYRVFFRCEKGKKKVDKVLKQHKYFLHCPDCFSNQHLVFNNEVCCGKQMQWAGPLWSGKLHDQKILKKMVRESEWEAKKLLQLFSKEDSIDSCGFYDIHSICKKFKIKNLPKFEELIKLIETRNYMASRTQFDRFGLKSNISSKELVKICKLFKAKKQKGC